VGAWVDRGRHDTTAAADESVATAQGVFRNDTGF
jgi:hypothetical protein